MEIEVSVKRCNPVPNSQFQTHDPKISQMCRDELYANVKKAQTWPRGKNPLADAIMDEWNGRYNYWAQEDLKAKVGVHNEEVGFREEVIEELVTQHGYARHVAAELTNTETKLMAKAREIGYI